MVYTRTITKEGNDCLIAKDAHIVAIYDENGRCIGYVATCSTIYRGCWGFDTMSQSFVYDVEHLDEAKAWCDGFIGSKGRRE